MSSDDSPRFDVFLSFAGETPNADGTSWTRDLCLKIREQLSREAANLRVFVDEGSMLPMSAHARGSDMISANVRAALSSLRGGGVFVVLITPNFFTHSKYPLIELACAHVLHELQHVRIVPVYLGTHVDTVAAHPFVAQFVPNLADIYAPLGGGDVDGSLAHLLRKSADLRVERARSVVQALTSAGGICPSGPDGTIDESFETLTYSLSKYFEDPSAASYIPHVASKLGAEGATTFIDALLRGVESRPYRTPSAIQRLRAALERGPPNVRKKCAELIDAYECKWLMFETASSSGSAHIALVTVEQDVCCWWALHTRVVFTNSTAGDSVIESQPGRPAGQQTKVVDASCFAKPANDAPASAERPSDAGSRASDSSGVDAVQVGTAAVASASVDANGMRPVHDTPGAALPCLSVMTRLPVEHGERGGKIVLGPGLQQLELAGGGPVVCIASMGDARCGKSWFASYLMAWLQSFRDPDAYSFLSRSGGTPCTQGVDVRWPPLPLSVFDPACRCDMPAHAHASASASASAHATTPTSEPRVIFFDVEGRGSTERSAEEDGETMLPAFVLSQVILFHTEKRLVRDIAPRIIDLARLARAVMPEDERDSSPFGHLVIIIRDYKARNAKTIDELRAEFANVSDPVVAPLQQQFRSVSVFALTDPGDDACIGADFEASRPFPLVAPAPGGHWAITMPKIATKIEELLRSVSLLELDLRARDVAGVWRAIIERAVKGMTGAKLFLRCNTISDEARADFADKCQPKIAQMRATRLREQFEALGRVCDQDLRDKLTAAGAGEVILASLLAKVHTFNEALWESCIAMNRDLCRVEFRALLEMATQDLTDTLVPGASAERPLSVLARFDEKLDSRLRLHDTSRTQVSLILSALHVAEEIREHVLALLRRACTQRPALVAFAGDTGREPFPTTDSVLHRMQIDAKTAYFYEMMAQLRSLALPIRTRQFGESLNGLLVRTRDERRFEYLQVFLRVFAQSSIHEVGFALAGLADSGDVHAVSQCLDSIRFLCAHNADEQALYDLNVACAWARCASKQSSTTAARDCVRRAWVKVKAGTERTSVVPSQKLLNELYNVSHALTSVLGTDRAELGSSLAQSGDHTSENVLNLFDLAERWRQALGRGFRGIQDGCAVLLALLFGESQDRVRAWINQWESEIDEPDAKPVIATLRGGMVPIMLAMDRMGEADAYSKAFIELKDFLPPARRGHQLCYLAELRTRIDGHSVQVEQLYHGAILGLQCHGDIDGVEAVVYKYASYLAEGGRSDEAAELMRWTKLPELVGLPEPLYPLPKLPHLAVVDSPLYTLANGQYSPVATPTTPATPTGSAATLPAP